MLNLLKPIFSITLLTLISRILGYIRDMIIAYNIGTGIFSDIFIIAFKIPNIFRGLFGEGAMNNAFVPHFSKLLETKGYNIAMSFASKIHGIFIVVLVLFSMIIIIKMPLVLNIIAPAFNHRLIIITSSRIAFPYLIFISLAGFYGSILNNFNVFIPYIITPIILNIVLICAALLSHHSALSSYPLVYGIFIAGVLQIVWMIAQLKKHNIKLYYSAPSLNLEIKNFLRNAKNSMLSFGMLQINNWFDMFIISSIPSAISYTYFADRIIQFPVALIGTVLGTVIFPTLTKKISSNNITDIKTLTYHSFCISLFFAIPASLSLFVLGEQIITIIFARGQFDASSTMGAYKSLKFLALGIPAFLINKLLSIIFYAYGNSKIPVQVNSYMFFNNIILSFILLSEFSYASVSLSSTITAYTGSICLFIKLRDEQKWLKELKIYKEIKKYIIATILMLVINKFISIFFIDQMKGAIIYQMALCMILYMILTQLLKCEINKMIISLLLKRIGKK